MCAMLIRYLQLESAAHPVCLPDGNSKHIVGKDMHTLILTCPEFRVALTNESVATAVEHRV